MSKEGGKKNNVIRNDTINKKIMKKSMNEYTEIFTKQLNKYVKEYVEDNNITYKSIYNDSGIKKESFTNYTSNRMPRYTETLVFIKDYFDLPFSYLFGETSATKIENIDVGLSLGLTDKSISKLRQLKDTNDDIKLLIINSIIENPKFVDGIIKIWKEKALIDNADKNPRAKVFADSEIFYKFLLFNFTSLLENLIDSFDSDRILKKFDLENKSFISEENISRALDEIDE